MAKNKRISWRRQYGVVPYRHSPSGRVDVLLVTTRETQRWMVPKGWPSKRLGPLGTGLREALEEAGIVGAGGPLLGEFHYDKLLRSGRLQQCRVELFAMRVGEELADWPEKSERKRRWFDHRDAAAAVVEAQLRMILFDLPTRLERAGA